MNILVEPPILIPRPETEEWTMRLISLINKTKGNIDAPARILDLCSGSGCISLALARAAPDFFITGLDVSEKAIELSRQNALRNKVQNVVFKKVDIFNDEELDDARLTKYDMIVSNPPYIPPAEYDNLDKSVKDYEDIRALVGKYQGFNSSTASSTITTPQESGEAGLDFYYRIRELASKLLSPREKRVFSREIPSLVLEFGKGQGKAMRDIFGDYYHRVKEDFNQIERTIEIHPHAKRLK